MIRIEWYLLDSKHLIEIGDSCLYLNSLTITTNQIIDDGLNYLIQKVKCLKIFCIRADSIGHKLVNLENII